MRSVALCLVVFLQVHSMNCEKIISVQNGGEKGDWGVTEVCPEGSVATGFILQVEEDQGLFDDTALNGITLYCTDKTTQNVVQEIKSSVGGFGSWKRRFSCKSGYLVAFCLRVEHYSLDRTAANNIKFLCSNAEGDILDWGSSKSEVLEGDGLDWGSYGRCSDACVKGICGIRTRVEGKQGMTNDDTALNDVQFLCCSDEVYSLQEPTFILQFKF